MAYNLGSDLLHLPDSLKVDSRLLVGSDKTVEIRRGADNYTINRQSASALSNGQIIWNVVLNNPANTLIDSYMWAEIFFTCTISATGLSELVQTYLENNIAFRQYPLASITNTSTVTLNNQSVSTNPLQWIHSLSWFQPHFADKASTQSITPIFPDKAQTYNQMAGTNLSPLASYFSNAEFYADPRGIFVADWNTIATSDTAWTFIGVIREPIINGLLEYNPAVRREALPFINNFNIQLLFANNISRIFSIDTVTCPAITNVAVNFNSANLVMQWLTAPTNQMLPPRALRSFSTIVSQSTNSGVPVAPNSPPVQIVSQTYSFNQIPKKIWIYINNGQASDVVNGYGQTDTFFSIQNLNVLFNNRQSLLGNYTAADLYNNLCADAGCRITYQESQYFVGSVLELDPVVHFGLQQDQTSGMLGVFNFQVTATCTNIHPTATITPVIWVTTANESIMQTTSESISNLIQGYITQQDVIAANSLPASPSLFAEHDIYGAGIFDTIKSGLSSIFENVIKPLRESKILSTVGSLIPHPGIQRAAQIGRTLGFGGRYTPRREMEGYYESLVH